MAIPNGVTGINISSLQDIFFSHAVIYYIQILRALKEVTKGIDGVIIENNKFCISVHFRCVREEVKYDFIAMLNDQVAKK